ncbi:MAG: VWA domain-containing protein [Polyangiales bacterium]
MIRFETPLLLLAAAPFVVALLLRARHLPASLGPTRRRWVAGLLLATGLLAAAAAAGIELGRPHDARAVVVVLDRSRSVDGAEPRSVETLLGSLRRASRTMRRDDRLGLVVFGAEAATELLPSPRPPIGDRRAAVARDGTDVAAALRRALADLPEGYDARIVLVSDGNATSGDALGVAGAAAARGVPVDVVPIDRRPRPEVGVVRVRMPATAQEGEPIALRIVTRATQPTPVRVFVTRDGRPMASGEAVLSSGEDVLVLRDRAPGSGLHRYDARIEPLDPRHDGSRLDDEGGAFLRVEGEARALVVAETPAGAEALVDGLRASGLHVDLVDPSGIPSTLGELAANDLVVLADVPARRFTEQGLHDLASYVRDLGGGLLMLGAEHAFGLGGYASTPIEEVMPATFDLRRRRDRLSLAMVIAIDRSGSMSAPVPGGRQKIELANEAAARSASLLSENDRVAVFHVDTEVHETQPMTRVTEPGAIAAACRRATSGGGGIFVNVALRSAYDALGRENAQLRHVLLFSDGSDSEELAGTRELAREAARRRITTSIVSMGNGPDTPELEVLARLGGGRFYIVEDMTELPRIFTEETMEASRAAFAEKTFRPVRVEEGPAIAGIDFRSAPALGGLALVNARPEATVHLEAARDEPLLARWQVGLGRSAVFTTDAGGRYAQAWVGWSGYPALFGQLARDLARREHATDAETRVAIEQGLGRIVVEAVDREGRYRNYLELRARVAAPGGGTEAVSLVQTGAGRYEARFDAAAPGAYFVTVEDAEAGLVGTTAVVRPAGDELRGDGTDRAFLARLAGTSGGRERRDLASVFEGPRRRVFRYTPVEAEALALALLLFLASVAVRRLRTFRFARAKRATARDAAPADVAATVDALSAHARQRRGKGIGGALGSAPAPSGEAAGIPAQIAIPPTSGADAAGAHDASAAPDARGASSDAATLAERLLERKRKR